ncbi:MAG: CopG family transcriptional regulator [Stappia sp.]|uniref:DUF411 domain-containing protein n=1 Tax=Stappia sp. TaxID=1870903 RepID=UPI000C634E30|nr:DUF411 domain-containing protein [Stappia sp.]MAB00606.1 CopG family transcriptional regulator [Stappia sp.]MBM18676.1 CopG family transcriptional regulator [Stappia sp.]|tara:strand:+ start:83 stop:529 length:447 start_codon:yes stop_codon:yes gene_type:complete
MKRLSLAALLVASALATPALAAGGPAMTVFKSPWCGCCEAWAKIMEDAGFTVTIENREDLDPVKRQAGVPQAMEGCHTAMVDGYFVEGHVPVASVRRMLSERPQIAGIAVPGMPSGSPGMGEDASARYDVLSVDGSGKAAIYESVGAR